jgi:hypothetical protein
MSPSSAARFGFVVDHTPRLCLIEVTQCCLKRMSYDHQQ